MDADIWIEWAIKIKQDFLIKIPVFLLPWLCEIESCGGGGR